MDRDDQRRYFVVGSVILDIVTPLFRHRLENEYKNRGFTSLQAFVNSQPTIHILFHLRHTNVWCCQDKQNCRSRASLPLSYNQWSLVFTQVNTVMRNHLCHCQYTANPVQLDDLDITLAGLILLNCCNLGPAEENAIKGLRKFKNNYLSHNTKGRITETEYNTFWPDLIRLVLQLDNTKQDDLIRIENRPLDESLCAKYCLQLLDIHQKLDEMNDSLDKVVRNSTLIPEIHATIQMIDNLVQKTGASIQGVDIAVKAELQHMNKSLEELLFYAKRADTCQCYNIKDKSSLLPAKPYILGQSIFYLHHQFDLSSGLNVEKIVCVQCGDLMDDGRLLLCLAIEPIDRLLTFNADGSQDQNIPLQYRLLICNANGSQAVSLPLQYLPDSVVAVNNSAVALTETESSCIELYDINNKHKLISEDTSCDEIFDITTIDNKLVVHDWRALYIIDHQNRKTVEITEKMKEKEIYESFTVPCVHANSDRLYYSDDDELYCYSCTDDEHSTTTLPSTILSITSLQDGSLYVLCDDGSVQHVSPDGSNYETVTTNGLESETDCVEIRYNQKQRKLITFSNSGRVTIFHEI